MNTQNNETNHTPTPWVLDSQHGGPMVSLKDQADFIVADIGTSREWEAIGITDEDGFAAVVALASPTNAAFIVRACNSHDELLRHLRLLAEEDSQCASDWVQKKAAARAAIARAEGKDAQ